MGKAKRQRVSKKSERKQDDAARFDKSRSPGPEYVWHVGHDYVHKGLTIKVRGHWERNPNLVKPKAKPRRAKKSDKEPAGVTAESASNGLLALAKKNAEGKGGEGGA